MDEDADDKFFERLMASIREAEEAGDLPKPLPPSPVDNKIKEIFESLSSFEDDSNLIFPPKNPDVINYFEANPALIALVETDRSAPPQSVKGGRSVYFSHIQLHGDASQSTVAHLIAKLFRMAEFHAAVGENEAPPPNTIKALCADFPTVLLGGLAVIDGDIFIPSSCCTRFPESLMDWRQLLISGDKPWLGHDPSPWVEIQDDNFLVWPDGGMEEEKDPLDKPACFNRTQLKVALENVQQDIRDFLVPLRSWAMRYYPADAEVLVACFAKAFVDCNGD